jgi:hypothetical protein
MAMLALVVVLLVLLLQWEAAEAVKFMLLDERNVVRTNATLTLGAVEKHPAGAMIKEEREYEMRFDNMQPSVFYDPEPPADRKKWRAWYSSFTTCIWKNGSAVADRSQVPYCENAAVPQCSNTGAAGFGHPHGGQRGSGFLYAESDDGIHWVKPSLRLQSWKGSLDNNLIKLAMNESGDGGMTTGIYLDEAAAAGSAQRYKIAGGTNGAGAVAVSPDGIHWQRELDLQAQTKGRWDTPKNAVWDATRRQWILYLRSTPTDPDGTRIQAFSHSLTEDYMGNWSVAVPTGLNSSALYQPDGLVAFEYEGIYLGIGNVLNGMLPDRHGHTPTSGSGLPGGGVNMVLAYSTDGRRWQWVKPNDSLVPRGGGAGGFDACSVFGAKQDPLRSAGKNDTLRLYYVGCNGPFFGSRGCGLGLATLPRDHWAGYRGGQLVTAPVRVSGSTLNVSVDGGSTTGIRVGLLGDPVLTIENCDPIRGKVVDAVVRWKAGTVKRKPWTLTNLTDGAVTLIFDIPADATAFAFSV